MTQRTPQPQIRSHKSLQRRPRLPAGSPKLRARCLNLRRLCALSMAPSPHLRSTQAQLRTRSSPSLTPRPRSREPLSQRPQAWPCRPKRIRPSRWPQAVCGESRISLPRSRRRLSPLSLSRNPRPPRRLKQPVRCLFRSRRASLPPNLQTPSSFPSSSLRRSRRQTHPLRPNAPRPCRRKRPSRRLPLLFRRRSRCFRLRRRVRRLPSRP